VTANPGRRDGKLKVGGMTASPRPTRRQAQGDVMRRQTQCQHDGKRKTTRCDEKPKADATTNPRRQTQDDAMRRQALGRRDGKP